MGGLNGLRTLLGVVRWKRIIEAFISMQTLNFILNVIKLYIEYIL